MVDSHVSLDTPLGTYVENGGLNIYMLVEFSDRLAKLRCVYFIEPEDLGDLIYCTHLDAEVWIAAFHLPAFHVSPIQAIPASLPSAA